MARLYTSNNISCSIDGIKMTKFINLILPISKTLIWCNSVVADRQLFARHNRFSGKTAREFLFKTIRLNIMRVSKRDNNE